MLDFEETLEQLSSLTLLKFFPADPIARLALAKLVGRMCSTPEQVDWLVSRCLDLWTEWEGPRELRAVLSSKFRPADGKSVGSSLERFSDGIPSERRIEEVPRPLLPAGHQVSADLEMERAVSSAAASMPTPRLPWWLSGVKAATADEVERLKRIQAENRERLASERVGCGEVRDLSLRMSAMTTPVTDGRKRRK